MKRIPRNSGILWLWVSATIFINSFITVKKKQPKKLFTEFSFKYISQVLKFYITRTESSWLKSHYQSVVLFIIPYSHGCVLTVYSSRLHSFWTKGKSKLVFTATKRLLCWSGGVSWPPASACRPLPPAPS